MNKQKDRLVELIGSKVCEEYSPNCDEYEPHTCEKCYANFCKVGDLADAILADGWMRPPCKVGDKVWDNDFGRPCSYIVTGFDVGKTLDDEENHKELFMYYENSTGSVQCNRPISQIGKTVFLTKEEAEQALKGVKK